MPLPLRSKTRAVGSRALMPLSALRVSLSVSSSPSSPTTAGEPNWKLSTSTDLSILPARPLGFIARDLRSFACLDLQFQKMEHFDEAKYSVSTHSVHLLKSKCKKPQGWPASSRLQMPCSRIPKQIFCVPSELWKFIFLSFDFSRRANELATVFSQFA